jgi:hypothetical protein
MLERIAALVPAPGLGIGAPILEGLAEREAQMVTVDESGAQRAISSSVKR